MSDPQGGQDQAPGQGASPGTPEPAAPEPATPEPAAQPAAAEPTASAGTGGWQTPDISSFGVPVAAGPTAGVSYADLVPRIGAFIIDVIILSVGFWVVWSLVFTTLFIVGGFGGVWIAIVLAIVGYLVASAVYFIFTWTKWRASPGQRILSLETVSATDGSTISQNVAIRRWLYLFGPNVIGSAFSLGAGYALGILSTVISVAVFAYYVYLLYSASQDPKRQGFHDKQSSTVVVKRAA